MPEYSDDDAKWHVDLISWLKDGIIGTADVALKFAEIVLEYTQGKAELEKQRPLTAFDQGDTWRIQGSWNANGNEAFGGPWRMICRKRDAQILDIGMPAVAGLSSEATHRIEEAKRLTRERDAPKRDGK